jgi:hypothetical protein
MVLRLLRALLGVPGLLAPVVQRNLFRETCPQRRGDRTTRLDRPPVPRTPCEETSGHRIPSRVRGDHDPPLLMDRMRGNLPVFCPTAQAIYFFRKDWTGRNGLRSKEKPDFGRKPGIEIKSVANPGFEGRAGLVPSWSICYIGAVDPARSGRPVDIFALVAELVDALP